MLSLSLNPETGLGRRGSSVIQGRPERLRTQNEAAEGEERVACEDAAQRSGCDAPSVTESATSFSCAGTDSGLTPLPTSRLLGCGGGDPRRGAACPPMVGAGRRCLRAKPGPR